MKDSSKSETVDDESSSEEEDEAELLEDGKPVLLWTNSIKDSTEEPFKRWGLSEFTVELLKLTPEYKAQLPPTDSRLRADR